MVETLTSCRYPLGESVGVEVRNHAVYLSGTVKWEYQRVAAQWEAEKVPGVHVLRNDIKVRPRCSAPEIGAAVCDDLREGGCGQSHEVTTDVDGARVAIAGSVCSYTEWLMASRAARSVRQVESVQNMTIVPQPEAH